MQCIRPAANILHTTENDGVGSRKSTFLRITGSHLAHEKIQNYAYVSDLDTIRSTKLKTSSSEKYWLVLSDKNKTAGHYSSLYESMCTYFAFSPSSKIEELEAREYARATAHLLNVDVFEKRHVFKNMLFYRAWHGKAKISNAELGTVWLITTTKRYSKTPSVLGHPEQARCYDWGECVFLNGSIDHCTCTNRVAILLGLRTPTKSNVLDDRNSWKNMHASNEVESLKRGVEVRCSKGTRTNNHNARRGRKGLTSFAKPSLKPISSRSRAPAGGNFENSTAKTALIHVLRKDHIVRGEN